MWHPGILQQGINRSDAKSDVLVLNSAEGGEPVAACCGEPNKTGISQHSLLQMLLTTQGNPTCEAGGCEASNNHSHSVFVMAYRGPFRHYYMHTGY